MCGIIGVAGASEHGAAPPLLDGLEYLTYRGYDSCGIATLANGRVERRRAAGRVANLQAVLKDAPMAGDTGIAHTRWATHGVPNETNAHPHGNAEVAIVHNGIVENFLSLRAELTDAGHQFETDTDSEAIAHLIVFHLRRGLTPEAAADAAFARLKGAFAVAAIVARAPGRIFVVRHGCPLTIGIGEHQTWVGSDALALAPFTDRIIHLNEGDRATVTAAGVSVRAVDGQPVERPTVTSSIVPTAFGKGGYRHYMQKEIHEQPIVIGDALRALLDTRAMRAEAPDLPFGFADIDRLVLVGCGTSHYAAGVARHWFEELAQLPVDVDISSEFQDRAPLFGPAGRSAAMLISQSGETADTLAALRQLRAQRVPTVALVNMTSSTMANEADAVVAIHAGSEISVASTKAFTAQLATLACLALAAGRARGKLDSEHESRLAAELTAVPAKMADILAVQNRLQDVASDLIRAPSVLYLGRGPAASVAREGALKMKEISYIHAEAYPMGELKHGPLALIDEHVPTVGIVPSDPLFAKNASNLAEVNARNGPIILVSDDNGISELGETARHTIKVPHSDPFVAPLLYAVPLQLLAYHAAVLKGTDVDNPRNLAKTVTVS